MPFPHPLWTTQISRTQGGAVHVEEYEWGVLKLEYTLDDEYTYPWMDNEEPDNWTIRTYPIPRIEDPTDRAFLNAIFNDVVQFDPTIAYLNKDSSFIAIKFGNDRSWMDLRKTDVNHVDQKFEKRVSFHATPSHLHDRVLIQYVDDDRYHAHVPGLVTVKFTDEFDERLVDGNSIIRPELLEYLIGGFEERCKDDDKAARLAKKFEETSSWQFRFLMERGLAKGDAVVADEGVLDVDVLIPTCNLKHSVSYSVQGEGLMHLIGHDHNNSVRTNPQTIVGFYDLLFKPDNLVKNAFSDEIDRVIDDFSKEKLFFNLDDRPQQDRIRNIWEKIVEWKKVMDLSDSLHLSQMYAGQIDRMLNPIGNPMKKRRFPVPFAKRYSLRSATTYRLVYGCDPDINPGEVLIDRIGAVVHDDDFEEICTMLGGADQDDIVELHVRIAIDNDKFLRVTINAGDMVAFIIRNPVGITSNGEHLGIEYYVLKVAEKSRYVAETMGVVPKVKMADRPRSTLEINLPQPTFVPSNPVLPNEYTFQYFWEKVELMAKYQGLYGIHSLQMTAYYSVGKPFKFFAPEETFVDACQQTRTPADLKKIAAINKYYATGLRGEGVDTLLAKRLKLSSKTRGIFSELAEYHREQTARFAKFAREHLHKVYEDLKKKYEGSIPQTMHNGMPGLLNLILMKGEGSSSENEILGNKVADEIDRYLEQGQITEDEVESRFIDAYRWIWGNYVSLYKSQVPPVHNVYSKTDEPLMRGRLFDWLIRALTSESSKGES